ncbi:MAG: type II toxin-antitoxin system RelE/ParE family toxin [Deltaproteobacteria bacterium]|nr:type II toxin-antitoxin system RelE/ParE family toxin [Deltaproteobacteria bacterium]
MAYYENERPALGLDLLDAIEETVTFAAEVPAGGERRSHELDTYETRRFLVRRFPYLVYVARIEGRREVVAIAHASRQPEYWGDRLK